MAILATNNSKPRELIPAGNYIARCYQMIEIGTIEEVVMNVPKILTKVRIGWELPTELKVFNPDKGEQPLVISKEYTLSMHEKSNLRKDLKSWRGKDFSEEEAKAFDITKLVGAPCMLNIIHTPGKSDASVMYQQISGITPMPKGVVCPKAINPYFILSYDNFDDVLFNSLPDFIKDRMKISEEYNLLNSPQQAHVGNDYDDINNQLVNDSVENDLPF